MSLKWKVGLLAAASLILVSVYMLTSSGGNWDYILPRRGMKILAMVITGSTIAVSTVIFQTITNKEPIEKRTRALARYRFFINKNLTFC